MNVQGLGLVSSECDSHRTGGATRGGDADGRPRCALTHEWSDLRIACAMCVTQSRGRYALCCLELKA